MRHGYLVTGSLLLAACNSVLGIEDVALESPDASIGQMTPPDAPPANCKLDAHYATVTATASNALAEVGTDGGPLLLVNLDADQTDTFFVQLHDNKGGHGVFGDGGSYPLSQSDASLASCGICTLGSGDYDSQSGTAAQSYVARATGELSVTTRNATTFAGRFRNLVLRHVILNSDTKTTTDDPDGCTSAIDDLQFNLPFTPTFAPGTLGPAALRAR